jgi:hypothetical protein
MQLRFLATLTAVGFALLAFNQPNKTLASAKMLDDTTKRVPVIVELFTSEGCSDCPPADALLAKLEAKQPVPGAEIIVLGEHVDYWDHQGWRDRFSSREFTDRQQDFVSQFKLDSAYTPQMVVDGATQLNGANASGALKAIGEAAKQEKTEVSLQLVKSASGDVFAQYGVDEAKDKRNADLFLAVTETNLETEVKKGENGGHTLHHTGVVRFWKKFPVQKMSVGGSFPIKLDPSWKRADVRVVAFVQDKHSLRILGAASEKLPE